MRKTLSIADRKEAIRTACMLAEKGDIIQMFEGMAKHLFKELRGVELTEPFIRMPWAIRRTTWKSSSDRKISNDGIPEGYRKNKEKNIFQLVFVVSLVCPAVIRH